MHKVYGPVGTYASSVGWRVIYWAAECSEHLGTCRVLQPVGAPSIGRLEAQDMWVLRLCTKEAHIIDALAVFSPTKTRVPDF